MCIPFLGIVLHCSPLRPLRQIPLRCPPWPQNFAKPSALLAFRNDLLRARSELAVPVEGDLIEIDGDVCARGVYWFKDAGNVQLQVLREIRVVSRNPKAEYPSARRIMMKTSRCCVWDLGTVAE